MWNDINDVIKMYRFYSRCLLRDFIHFELIDKVDGALVLCRLSTNSTESLFRYESLAITDMSSCGIGSGVTYVRYSAFFSFAHLQVNEH